MLSVACVNVRDWSESDQFLTLEVGHLSVALFLCTSPTLLTMASRIAANSLKAAGELLLWGLYFFWQDKAAERKILPNS